MPVLRTASLTVFTLLLTSAVTAEERRELGVHQHGHSKLALAIEGNRVTMELTAPGADIAGFEHEAETDEQRAVLARAEDSLADPLALFVLPPQAGCRVEQVEVTNEAEREHASQEHDGAEHAADESDGHGHEGHAEFHAAYALSCDDPVQIGWIDFAYFNRFPGAQEVEVTVLSDTGQTAYEVTRSAPRLALDASM